MQDRKTRRLLFAAMTAIGVLLAIEALARIGYRYAFAEFYSANAAAGDATASEPSAPDAELPSRDPVPAGLKWDVIHPYIGFVGNGDARNHGFGSLEPVVSAPAKGRLVVAILGGSVANLVAPVFEQELRGSLAPSVELVYLNLARPGYKQPQQLMAIAFLMSIGAHFDVVINLDGYNEVVLPYIDNYLTGTFPFFPRQWDSRVDRLPSREALLEFGRIALLRESAEAMRERQAESPWRISAVYGWIARLQRDGLLRQISESQVRLQNLPSGGGFEAHGPYVKYPSREALEADLVRVWFRSSELLSRLVAAPAEYYHFLQPNQYVAGSKPLTRHERRNAISPGAHGELVANTYPRMIELGPGIDGPRSHFVDATRIFEAVERTLYFDACCHFNADGSRLLSEFMLRAIVQRSNHDALRAATLAVNDPAP